MSVFNTEVLLSPPQLEKGAGRDQQVKHGGKELILDLTDALCDHFYTHSPNIVVLCIVLFIVFLSINTMLSIVHVCEISHTFFEH